MGLKNDYTRDIIAIVNIQTESVSGWEQVLEEQKERGVKLVHLFVSDGLRSLKPGLCNRTLS
jgi:putative transposase